MKATQYEPVWPGRRKPLARAADGGYLLADALGLPLDDGTSLFTFIAAVIAIPQMRQVGACLGTGNLFCAVQAVRVLTANAKATDALLSAIRDYEVALGSSIAPDLLKKLSPKWLAKHLSEELFKVLTTGSWVLQFGGQVAFSPAGYVAFDTVPSP